MLKTDQHCFQILTSVYPTYYLPRQDFLHVLAFSDILPGVVCKHSLSHVKENSTSEALSPRIEKNPVGLQLSTETFYGN